MLSTENTMASHTSERGGNAAAKAADKPRTPAASAAAKSAAHAVDDKKGQAADRLDEAADAVGEHGKGAPEPAPRYARATQEKLHEAADYVRDTDARQMGRDAMDTATSHPVASLLIVSAVVIGGSFLLAAVLRNEEADSQVGARRKAMGLASAANGLGPKGIETLTKIRDAAFSFAMARAVDTAEQLFPGFRAHYERG